MNDTEKVYKKFTIGLILVEIIFIFSMLIGTYSYFVSGQNLGVFLQPLKFVGWIYFAILIYLSLLLVKNKISLESILKGKNNLSKSLTSAGLYLMVAFIVNPIILFTKGEVDYLLPLNLILASPFVLISLIFAVIFLFRKTDNKK